MNELIVRISGGLGNQMFQYAAGLAVAKKKKADLLLDLDDYASNKHHHGFELDRVFSCHIGTASQEQVRNILGWRYPPTVRRLLTKAPMGIFRGQRFIVEPHFNYWKGIFDIETPCYLQGYWQSERYFKGITDQVRAAFRFRGDLSEKNEFLVQEMKAANSVSIHVRRGDYVHNSSASATHGVCDLGFYRDAILYIKEIVDNPCFYVFSDDIEWVSENLHIEGRHKYIRHNVGEESYNDMRLMSACRHNIIANSTFSWWGAWLNSFPDKVIVAPLKWFAITKNTQDLLPRDWVKI